MVVVGWVFGGLGEEFDGLVGVDEVDLCVVVEEYSDALYLSHESYHFGVSFFAE